MRTHQTKEDSENKGHSQQSEDAHCRTGGRIYKPCTGKGVSHQPCIKNLWLLVAWEKPKTQLKGDKQWMLMLIDVSSGRHTVAFRRMLGHSVVREVETPSHTETLIYNIRLAVLKRQMLSKMWRNQSTPIHPFPPTQKESPSAIYRKQFGNSSTRYKQPSRPDRPPMGAYPKN